MLLSTKYQIPGTWYLKPFHIFAIALTASVIVTSQIVDLVKVGKGNGVQLFAMLAFDGKYQNL